MSDIQDPTTPGTTEPEAPTRPAEYVADISFEDMNLSEPIRRAIAERGYTNPTPVQAKAFGPAMAGQGPHRPQQDRHGQDGRLRPAAAGEDLPEDERGCAPSSSAPPASWRSRWPRSCAPWASTRASRWRPSTAAPP